MHQTGQKVCQELKLSIRDSHLPPVSSYTSASRARQLSTHYCLLSTPLLCVTMCVWGVCGCACVCVCVYVCACVWHSCNCMFMCCVASGCMCVCGSLATVYVYVLCVCVSGCMCVCGSLVTVCL